MKLFLLLMFLGVGFNTTAQQTKLHLASDIWPPFTNENEKHSFAIDLVKGALIRMEMSMKNDILKFEEVVNGIKNGAYDGSAALWRSQEREKILHFSDPYLQNQLILVGRKGSDVSAASFSDLQGKRVGVVGTYAYGEAVENANRVNFIPGKNDQENLEKLIKYEVDYMLVDALLIQYLVLYQQEDMLKYLAIGTKPLITRSLHFALRKDIPQSAQIIKRFNTEILKMVADGSYNRILKLNWIRADVNGDGKMELVLNGDRAGTIAPTSSYNVYLDNPSTNVGHGYYVAGNFYQTWENIPQKYKVAPMKSEDLSKIGMLSFRF